MFAKDRDLLVLEPRLLDEVAWMGQRVHAAPSVTITGDGVGVTDGAGVFGSVVGVGAVLLLDGLAVEVVEVGSATEATISLIRADREAAPIPASSLGSSAAMQVYTFSPQIGLVHDQVLRGLGLAPGVTEAGGAVAEDRVTNGASMASFEALGALHLVYAGAAPLAGEPGAIERKAASYRARFAASRMSIGAELDLDGDGVADATRRVGAFQLMRR